MNKLRKIMVFTLAVLGTNYYVYSLKGKPVKASERDLLTDLPQLPFEVTYEAYGRTIEVVSSCDHRKDAITLKVAPTTGQISRLVYSTLNRGFETEGIKRIQVCRTTEIVVKYHKRRSV